MLHFELERAQNLTHNQKNISYLESDRFWDDLLDSQHDSAGMSIYFGIQNVVFEEKIQGEMTDTEFLTKKGTTKPITVVSWAAADNRFFVGGLDSKCSSNPVLRGTEDSLETMIRAGVANQCNVAINKSKNQDVALSENQDVALMFIMPGCLAFDNEPEEVMDYFFDELAFQYYYSETMNIPFHVVELNKDLHDRMEQVWERKNLLYANCDSIQNIMTDLNDSNETAAGFVQCRRAIDNDNDPKSLVHSFEKIIRICQSRIAPSAHNFLMRMSFFGSTFRSADTDLTYHAISNFHELKASFKGKTSKGITSLHQLKIAEQKRSAIEKIDQAMSKLSPNITYCGYKYRAYEMLKDAIMNSALNEPVGEVVKNALKNPYYNDENATKIPIEKTMTFDTIEDWKPDTTQNLTIGRVLTLKRGITASDSSKLLEELLKVTSPKQSISLDGNSPGS